jgi:hypothetical protein
MSGLGWSRDTYTRVDALGIRKLYASTRKGKAKSIMGIMTIDGRTRTRRKRAVEGAVSLSVAVETISAGLKAFLCHPGDSLGDQNVLSESLLLEKFKCSNGRARVAGRGRDEYTSHVARLKIDLRQVFDVLWLCKVLEVGEVCNELWIVEQLLGCQVIEVERVGQALNKLQTGRQR